MEEGGGEEGIQKFPKLCYIIINSPLTDLLHSLKNEAEVEARAITKPKSKGEGANMSLDLIYFSLSFDYCTIDSLAIEVKAKENAKA